MAESEGTEDRKSRKGSLCQLPSDKYELAGLCVLCLTILIGVGLILRFTRHGGKAEIGFSELHISASGGPATVESESELRLVQFWTPSEDTRSLVCEGESEDCLKKCRENTLGCQTDCESRVLAGNRWECSVTADDVARFDEALYKKFCARQEPHGIRQILGKIWDGVANDKRTRATEPATVTGFHRLQEYGRASERPGKHGLWWEMTVTKDFDVKEFAEFYVKRWCKSSDQDCREKAVYLEVINGSAGYTPSR